MSKKAEIVYANVSIGQDEYSFNMSNQKSGESRFQFLLQKKPVTWGELEFEQWWMPIDSLYGARKTEPVNQLPLLNLFWDMCQRMGTDMEKSVYESYLLCHLLPHARSNGSRRILNDAFLTISRQSKQLRQKQTQELDSMLRDLLSRTTSHQSKEEIENHFRTETAKYIRTPDIEDHIMKLYSDLTQEILEESFYNYQTRGESAIAEAVQKWKKVCKDKGRRRGNQDFKYVLDIISYECRAAVHRCYSSFWCTFLELESKELGMNAQARLFHETWHTQNVRDSRESATGRLHLFHGHIFALHPACGPVLQTETGQIIFAEWLNKRSPQTYDRMLQTISTAVYYYSYTHDAIKTERKESLYITHGVDINQLPAKAEPDILDQLDASD